MRNELKIGDSIEFILAVDDDQDRIAVGTRGTIDSIIPEVYGIGVKINDSQYVGVEPHEIKKIEAEKVDNSRHMIAIHVTDKETGVLRAIGTVTEMINDDDDFLNGHIKKAGISLDDCKTVAEFAELLTKAYAKLGWARKVIYTENGTYTTMFGQIIK